MLKPVDFFDLSKFRHTRLFAGTEYAWDALKLLEEYLDEHFRRNAVFIHTTRFAEHEREVFTNLIEPYSIGEGRRIESCVRITNSIIGKNCHIVHGADIRDSVIGDNCVIAGQVKRSIVMDGVHKGHVGYLGDSIVGNNCNLAEQTASSNLEHRGLKDKNATIWLKFTDHCKAGPCKHDTGLHKLGVIMGDGSLTASGTFFSPGTLIAKKSFTVKSGTVPKGYHSFVITPS